MASSFATRPVVAILAAPYLYVESSVVFARKPLLLYLIVLLFLQLTLCIASWHHVRAGSVDFRNFYADGYLVRTGHGSSLYDYAAQVEVQNRLISSATGALPLMVPPLTAVVFAPISYFSYLQAFCVFAGINLLLATLSALWVGPFFSALFSFARMASVLLFLGFLPLGFALSQGQLSIVLLAIYCAVFVALRSKHDLLAGLVLSLGLVKFQIAIPVAVLFLLWRQWRFIAGFLIGASAFIAGSLAVVGTAHVADMFRSIFSASASLSPAAQLQYGLYFDRMPNLYGLMYALSNGAKWAVVPALLASVLLVAWAARRRPSLELALPIALLVSYHLYLHDLTLLLLPFASVLDWYLATSGDSTGPASLRRKTISVATSALLLFPLLAVCLIPTRWISLLCFPMIFITFALATSDPVADRFPAKASA